MTSIADQLRAIADQLDGLPPVTAPEPAPEGQVAVYPTGINGKGKVRLYPTPESFGRGTTVDDLDLWGYYTLVTNKNVGPYAFSGVQNLAMDHATFAEAVDRIEHPEDWTTAPSAPPDTRPWISGGNAIEQPQAPAPLPPPDAPVDVEIKDEG